MLHCLFRRFTHIFQLPISRPTRHRQYSRRNMKIRNKREIFRMRLSPSGDGILEVYHQLREDQDRPGQDKSNMGLQDSEGQDRYPKLFRVLQLQWTIHQRFQQDSTTCLRLNSGAVRWQMRTDRQRTRRIQRNKKETYYSTGYSPFQPQSTNLIATNS